LVFRIDEQVAQEGYKMNTPAYWEKLESKMKEYMPERFESETKSQYQPRKSHVGASVTNSTPAPNEREKMRFKDYEADVLIRQGYLSEDRKTILNKEMVKKYYNDWKRVKESARG